VAVSGKWVFVAVGDGVIVYVGVKVDEGVNEGVKVKVKDGVSVSVWRRAKITSHFETAELIGVWFDSVVPGRQEIVWMKI